MEDIRRAMLARRGKTVVPLRYRVLYWTGLLLCFGGLAIAPGVIAGVFLIPLAMYLFAES